MRLVFKTDYCWLWTGAVIKGYGSFGVFCKTKSGRRVRTAYAHRVSWVLVRGSISEGVEVLHKCDNPLCIRPSHLFSGDAKSNADDRDGKGRRMALAGEDCNWSKLKLTQVKKILWLVNNTTIIRKYIAAAAGVHPGTISRIARRIQWAHVPVPKERPT